MTIEKEMSEDPVFKIKAAIWHERMQNPYCPIAVLLNELLEMHNNGDDSALDMALLIANESLAPRKANIFNKLSSFFRKR